MNYVPENPPIKTEELANYVYRELLRVGAVLDIAVARQVEFLTVPPSKPREGMVRGADGAYWNPGSGKGVYVYYGNVWNKL